MLEELDSILVDWIVLSYPPTWRTCLFSRFLGKGNAPNIKASMVSRQCGNHIRSVRTYIKVLVKAFKIVPQTLTYIQGQEVYF